MVQSAHASHRNPSGYSPRRSEEHTSELQSPMYLVCPQIHTLSLHDALPIYNVERIEPDAMLARAIKIVDVVKTRGDRGLDKRANDRRSFQHRRLANWEWSRAPMPVIATRRGILQGDRKSTRLNSSHRCISYAHRSTHFPYTTLFRSTTLKGSSPTPCWLGPLKSLMWSKPAATEASTNARMTGVASSIVGWRIGNGPERPCQSSQPVGVFSKEIGRAHV